MLCVSTRNEFQDDPENRIVRPFQVYKGYDLRELPHTSKAARPKVSHAHTHTHRHRVENQCVCVCGVCRGLSECVFSWCRTLP